MLRMKVAVLQMELGTANIKWSTLVLSSSGGLAGALSVDSEYRPSPLGLYYQGQQQQLTYEPLFPDCGNARSNLTKSAHLKSLSLPTNSIIEISMQLISWSQMPKFLALP